MKKIYIFIIAIVLIAGFVLTNTILERRHSEISNIANKITCIAISDRNWQGEIKTWTWQEKLKELCSNNDLIALADTHHNAAIRAYAFEVLVKRGDPRYHNILYNSLNDTASFEILTSDTKCTDNVANYNVSLLTDIFGFSSIEDSLTLDSTLLHTPNMGHISHLKHIVDHPPIEEQYYNRLYEIYSTEGVSYILPKLCLYRREELKNEVIKCLLEKDENTNSDICNGDVFKEKINIGLEAVAVWPHPDFIPTLIKIRDSGTLNKDNSNHKVRTFYLALMAYDDEQSYHIIEKTLKTSAENQDYYTYHEISFGAAYKMNPKPRYKHFILSEEKQCIKP